MKKIYTYFAGGLIIIVVVGVWLFMTERNRLHQEKNANTKVSSFVVTQPFFEAHGMYLSRVEIWGIPAGTKITEKDYVKIGDAVVTNTTKGDQVWRLQIPRDPILLTEVFARGFNQDNKMVNQISLGERGATEIIRSLWPAVMTDIVLKIGDEKETLGLKVKLVSVDADSRCPLGVMCIRAGDVKMTLSLSTLGTSTDAVISTDAETRFAGYTVSVKEVAPVKRQGMINRNEYSVTFTISFNK